MAICNLIKPYSSRCKHLPHNVTVCVFRGTTCQNRFDAGNISRVMTGNRSGCTLIIRQMCHNVPPTAINTSVEFILKTEICILWLYIHISRECGVLGNNKTHTLRSKSCNYALNVFKWCTKTLNSYSYCALTYKNNYIITNTKFKLTTTKLCQVRLLSPWSRWRSLWNIR